jgi:hypothetical protein
MHTRAFLFAAWIAAGKTLSGVVSLLETIASGQVEVFQRGGKTLISTSIGSESFSYQLSGSLSTDAVTSMSYDAWRAAQRFSTDGELEEWLKAEDISSFRASFRNMRDL